MKVACEMYNMPLFSILLALKNLMENIIFWTCYMMKFSQKATEITILMELNFCLKIKFQNAKKFEPSIWTFGQF